jgi:hypothetical protein
VDRGGPEAAVNVAAALLGYEGEEDPHGLKARAIETMKKGGK